MSDLLAELTYDERQVYFYIKNWSGQFISTMEIARRADGKARFDKDRNWAYIPLSSLKDHGYITCNEHSQYKIKTDIDPSTGEVMVEKVAGKASKNKKFIAPALQAMLDQHELEKKPVEAIEENPVKQTKFPKFIAPEIAAILRKNGKLQD